jgi:hypothetical protein
MSLAMLPIAKWKARYKNDYAVTSTNATAQKVTEYWDKK